MTALALVVAACGGDDDETPSGTTATGGSGGISADAGSGGKEAGSGGGGAANTGGSEAGTGGAANTGGSEAGTGGAANTGGSEAGTGGADAAPDAAGDVAADASDAGSCNAVVNAAPVVTATTGVGAAPTPAGGTLVVGTYYLTALTRYVTDGGTPPSESGSETMAFSFSSGTTYLANFASQQAGGTEDHTTRTFVAAGTTLTGGQSCPSSSPSDVLGYTSAAPDGGKTTLLVFRNDSDYLEVRTYTEQ